MKRSTWPAPEVVCAGGDGGRIFTIRTTAAVTLSLLLTHLVPAAAEMTEKDLQVAARSLAFLTDRDISHLKVAILYAPDVPASKQEADDLARAIGTSLITARATLVPVSPLLLSVGNMPELAGRDVAFVTQGLERYQEAIAAAAVCA